MQLVIRKLRFLRLFRELLLFAYHCPLL